VRGAARLAGTLLVAGLSLLRPTAPGAACAPGSAPADAPLALVLSGGGAKGAWEVGVAAALREHAVPLRLVAGSSAGALTAVMLADGRMDRLEALWRGLTRDQVYRLRASVIFAGLLPGWLTLLTLNASGSLFDPAPLRELLTASLDLDRVRASSTEVLVITTDLAERGARIFDNRTLSVDALLAATAVPGAFPPVTLDGHVLVDGGLTGRAPVLPALERAPAVARALVLLSYATDERASPSTSLRRVLEESFELAMVHQIHRDVELARLKYPAVDVQLLTPSAPLDLRPLDFDPAGVAAALDRGRADGAACARAWQGR
jgi:NTE family protein